MCSSHKYGERHPGRMAIRKIANATEDKNRSEATRPRHRSAPRSRSFWMRNCEVSCLPRRRRTPLREACPCPPRLEMYRRLSTRSNLSKDPADAATSQRVRRTLDKRISALQFRAQIPSSARLTTWGLPTRSPGESSKRAKQDALRQIDPTLRVSSLKDLTPLERPEDSTK